jgi:hypothetical protein
MTHWVTKQTLKQKACAYRAIFHVSNFLFMSSLNSPRLYNPKNACIVALSLRYIQLAHLEPRHKGHKFNPWCISIVLGKYFVSTPSVLMIVVSFSLLGQNIAGA